MNSSPPKRATTSLLRTDRVSTAAVRRRASSPAGWPWVSLISLNRSTSTISDRQARPVPSRRLPVATELVLQGAAVDQAGQAVAVRPPLQLIHPLAQPEPGAEPRQQLGGAGRRRHHVQGPELERRDPLLGRRAAAVQDDGDPIRRDALPQPSEQVEADARRQVPPGQDQARLDPRRLLLGRGQVGADVDLQPAGRQLAVESRALRLRGLDHEHATGPLRRRNPIRPARGDGDRRDGDGIGRRFAGHRRRRRHGGDSHVPRSESAPPGPTLASRFHSSIVHQEASCALRILRFRARCCGHRAEAAAGLSTPGARYRLARTGRTARRG